LPERFVDDHVLVHRVLDLGWRHEEVAGRYDASSGRPSLEPEVAVRLMLAGFLLGFVPDRRLMREAQVNLAIRWFCGYGLAEALPDHSSLTRIRQRWGAQRFRRIFERTVRACLEAKVAKAAIVHIDASPIRAEVSWESLVAHHVEAVAAANPLEDEEAERRSRKTWHGLARAVRRGLANMQIQAYLTAAAINLKRLAAVLLAILTALWTRPFRSRRQRHPDCTLMSHFAPLAEQLASP
jgi:transposase